jgi:nucleoside-diphosphate-sugar epimerase
MTTVAITGATGFVGSSLAKALAAQDFDIIALARPTSNRRALSDLNVTWIEGDVTDPYSIKGILNNADWLVHAAGILGRPGIPEKYYHLVHVEGTRNILNEASHCSRILIISSPGVLGPINGPPAGELTQMAPSNAYERSKAAAEKVALNFSEQHETVIITRPEFIYGPGDTHVLGLFRAVQKGMFFYVDDGNFICHPTFIDDAVDGMLLCLLRGIPGEIYHIAGPSSVTFRELGNTIADALDVRRPWLAMPRWLALAGATAFESAANLVGKQAPLSRSGVAFFSENRRFSWEKANEALGYQPNFDLRTGVQQTVNWYQVQGLL